MAITIPARTPASATDDWHRMCRFLPADLDALARQTGAVTRWRGLRSGALLVRLLLLWALTGFGLRTLAAWATRGGWWRVTEGALRHRFRACEALLRALLAHLLGGWLCAPLAPGHRLRLVDASTLAAPGATHGSWRLHVVYDPAAGRFVEVDLTDHHGGETLTRAAHVAGDLVLADRGLAHAAALVATAVRGVWWLVRCHFQNLALRDAAGAPLDVRAVLARAAAAPCETVVRVCDGATTITARLVVAALPPAKAAAARAKVAKRAAKRGRTPDAWALELAGYVCLLTTLPASVADAAAVLAWYRVRWQVELFFKRCKSLLRLHVVQSTDPTLVRVHLLAVLVVAALVDRLNGTRPGAAATAAAPAAVVELDGLDLAAVSLWRLTQLHWLDLVLAVGHAADLDTRLRARLAAEHALRERPRRRHARAAVVTLRALRQAVPPDLPAAVA